ncbi:MAG: OmpA family protein, partial [Woeseiaceae bacterium]|nr:OmpA family protein [Woeseiaceae bacterium]MDX2606888.1 OmpA family protein [Woeseiaceae bacterium]
LFILVLALSFATTAQAQWNEWYVAPSIVYFDDDPDRVVEDSFAGIQIVAGRNITERMSVEGLLGYSSIDGYSSITESYPDQKHLDISANLLAFYDRDRTFSPYLIVGIGYLGVSFSDSGGDDNRPSATAGAGFKWKMGNSNISIRAESRARFAWDDCSGGCNNLTDFITTLGVQYDFGKHAPAGKSGFDSDEDGVIDHWDRCPNTPPGASVDEHGCPRPDTDGDGVLDMWDECPDTPSGTQVTSRGCELKNMDRDADGDRVFDRIDECPNTPNGVPVDPVGCSLDSDRDGVTTGKDRCPATPPGAVVDIYGCSGDEDDDGVLDHLDECPNSTAGSTVDINGCEFTDVIKLPGVNFGAGSDLLLPGTEQLLKFAAATLNKHPSLQIEVAGHTDSDGAADTNYGLSERRAKTVRDYLIRYGVNANRLTAQGCGDTQPVAENETIRGRATNRRVELRIVGR